MPTVTFPPDPTGYACPYAFHADFTTACQKVIGDGIYAEPGYVGVGVWAPYYIYRSTPVYDTTTLDPSWSVTDAYEELNVSASTVGVPDTLVRSRSGGAYPHIPATVDDYDEAQYAGNGGQVAIPSPLPLGILTVPWEPSWIVKGGISKSILRFKSDIDHAAPAGTTYFYIDNTLIKPVLYVTYDVPSGRARSVMSKAGLII
jgi:hypothetical protein